MEEVVTRLVVLNSRVICDRNIRTGVPMTHDIWGPFGSEPHIVIIHIVSSSGSVG
jgi:hypothetical protein